MGSKTWLCLGVLSFACAALVGCNNTEKKKDVGTWGTPTPVVNKGATPGTTPGTPQPSFPGSPATGSAAGQQFPPYNTGANNVNNAGLNMGRSPTAPGPFSPTATPVNDPRTGSPYGNTPVNPALGNSPYGGVPPNPAIGNSPFGNVPANPINPANPAIGNNPNGPNLGQQPYTRPPFGN